ncbi:hypothetical protein [Pirellula sp. SH-Sr6A]|uniref:hypothetical protein n=1 Tax=Pirellula sp. SH-Sr6A TaxID=1632865 RepID=UPI0011BA90B1|nr:hypothetical protein [Pirellula sp. SH-Sr6A]
MPSKIIAIIFFWGIAWTCSLSQLTLSQSVSIDQLSRGKFLTFSNRRTGETGDLDAEIMVETAHAMKGHHRFHFRITPSKLGRFPTSQNLVLRISTFDYNSSGSTGCLVPISIVGGEFSARSSVLFKIDGPNSYLRISGTLNGRPLPGFSAYVFGDQRQWYSGDQKIFLNLISGATSSLSGPRRIAYQELEKLNRQTEVGNWYRADQLISQTEYGYGMVERLPKNWLELSHFGAIQIDGKDFLQLPDDSHRVLMQYVQAGGQLNIQRADQPVRIWAKLCEGGMLRYESLTRKESSKAARNLNDPSMDVVSGPRKSDFIYQNGDLLPGTVWDTFCELLIDEEIEVITGVYRARGTGGMGGSNPLAYPLQSLLEENGKEVLLGLLDQQLLFAHVWSEQFIQWNRLSFDEAVANDAVLESKIAQSTPTEAYEAALGLGLVRVSYDRTLKDQFPLESGITNASLRFLGGFGAGYWDWLIPSVGKTPVWSFLLFVVVFVGLVAPALIVWTNRTGRRVWLILWMPCLAFCATTALFAFGFIKDGFTSVSRIRSLTMVDRDGNGMVWSRQSYFSAYLPSDGIRFGKETMVTRVWATSENTTYQQWMREEGEETVYSGLLPARIQSQYLITHPVSELQVVQKRRPLSPDAAAPAVINRGTSKWLLGLFVDTQGAHYIIENIEPKQEAELVPIESEDAFKRLMSFYNQNPLRAPADAPMENQRSLSDSFWGRYYYASIDAEDATVEEKAWRALLGDPLLRLPSTMSPPEGTYILFTAQAPHVEKCLPDASESASLHAISGYW